MQVKGQQIMFRGMSDGANIIKPGQAVISQAAMEEIEREAAKHENPEEFKRKAIEALRRSSVNTF